MLIEPAPYARPVDALMRALGYDLDVWLVEPLAVLLYASIATTLIIFVRRRKLRLIALAVLLPIVALSGCVVMLGASCATGGGCV